MARLIELSGARLSPHALERSAELGFSEDEIHRCIAGPEQTYPGGPAYGPGRTVYQRGVLSVVLHDATRTVVTVLPRWQQRWEQGQDTRRTLFPA